MTQRLSKMEAATRLDVSASTIDRMIQKGELQTEKRASREPPPDLGGSGWRGKLTSQFNSPHEASEPSPDDSGEEMSDWSDASGEVDLAVLRERVRNLEELADYHRELLKGLRVEIPAGHGAV